MSIEVSHLTRLYGEQKAVDNISFQVGRGEIVGFLGPNGAGKSTTMKMITGFLKPTSGRTMVSGIHVQSDPLTAKRKIGYLPEANPLYHDMYVREYLGFVADVHRIPDSKKDRRHHRHSRSDHGTEKRTGQLSKGFKQRVGLAAALIHDPEVLILDEPTTGLDPNQIIEIREVIRNLGKNKTVLFSSHILQEVEALCDRIIIISKGRLVADDSISGLQRTGAAGRYVQVQFTESPGKAVFSEIKELTRVEELASGHYRLFSDDPDKSRKELLQLSLRHNLNIVSLQTGEQSLEEIFRGLTSGNPSE